MPATRLHSATWAATVALLLLALFSSLAIVDAQVDPSGTERFVAAHCPTDEYCVTALYTPSDATVNYTMIIKGSPTGWRAIGTGSKMAGSNMLIGWVANGQPVLSHRSATGEKEPKESQAEGSYTTDATINRVTDDMTVMSWIWPQTSSPGSSATYIWAHNPSQAMASTETGSDLSIHSKDGHFTLDFGTAYSGEAPVVPNGVPALAAYSGSGASTSNSSSIPVSTGSSSGSGGGAHIRAMDMMQNRLFVTHMVFMLLAWLVLVPAGILLARFGRTLFTWFPYHRGLMVAAVASVTIGFFVAVAGVGKLSGNHFANRHERLGLAVFVLTLVQAVLGQVGHVVRAKSGVRAQNFVHIALGLTTFGIAIWTIIEGFEVWSWWGVPRGAKIAVYVWTGILGGLFLLGLLLVPRELRRQAKESGDRKGTDSFDQQQQQQQQQKEVPSQA